MLQVPLSGLLLHIHNFFLMLGFALLLVAIGLFLAKRHYYALLLFFGFVTNGYQLIPPGLLMAGAPTDKLTDLALIFLVVALISRSHVLWLAVQREQVFRWVALFLVFIVIDGVYSIWQQGYEPGGVLRVFRVNLFLLSFGIFLVVPTPVLTRVFHTMAVITVVQSVIFLLQIPLGQALLNSTLAGSEVATTRVEKFAFTRFYNTPAYLTPVLFYYLFQFRHRLTTLHGLILGILLLTVMAPLHRMYIFSIVATASLYALFQRARSHRMLYVALLIILGYSVSLIDVIRYRIEEGFTDLGNTFKTSGSLATADYGTNTLAYRMAHLFERINYISASPEGYIFGIGLLSEDAKQVERLPFEVGAYNERTGRSAQINTGDIAWSLVILQLGFGGLILFVIALIKFIQLFNRYRTAPFATVGLLTLSVSILISFAGTELLMIPFRTMLVLLTVLVTKHIRERAMQPTLKPVETFSINSEKPRQRSVFEDINIVPYH